MAGGRIITDFKPVDENIITDFKPVNIIADFKPVEEKIITDFKPVLEWKGEVGWKGQTIPSDIAAKEWTGEAGRTAKGLALKQRLSGVKPYPKVSWGDPEIAEKIAATNTLQLLVGANKKFWEEGEKIFSQMPLSIQYAVFKAMNLIMPGTAEELQKEVFVGGLSKQAAEIAGKSLPLIAKRVKVLLSKKSVAEVEKAIPEVVLKESQKFIDDIYKQMNKFDSDRTAELVKQAEGIKKEGLFTKFKNAAIETGHKITRTYQHLSNTAENAEVINTLKRLEKQSSVAADTAARDISQYYGRGGKELNSALRKKVLLDDLANDLERGLYEGKDLPFDLTPDSLGKELQKFDEMTPMLKERLEIRDKIWDKIKTEYIKELKPYKPGVEDMFKENYFRHQVLDYVDNNGLYGTGKRLTVPKRGFEQARTGSAKLYNTDFLEAEHQVMSQMLYDTEIGRTLNKVDAEENIIKILKAEAKEKNINWRSLVPDTHTIWQPKEGNVFYPAMTIKESTMKKIMNEELNGVVDITKDLQEAIAIGGRKKEFVIRKEVAQTLDNLLKERAGGVVSSWDLGIMRKWKQWQLLSPRRYFKYNIRNLAGDTESTFLGNPGAFKKTPQAIEELGKLYSRKGEMTSNMQAWFQRGGVSSTLQAQEMDSLKKSWAFIDQYKDKKDWPNIFKKYWKGARLSTDFRESILRYASFLDQREKLIASGGKVTNYAASKPEMIDALKDIDDKAFWLSNDLLGAYDKVSVIGQTIRERLFPFWSWQEVNAKRYIQLFKNAANDGKLALTIGKKLGYKIPVTAMRVGKLAIKASALTSLLHVYNNTVHPDLEKQLPRDVQTTPHVIIGKNKEGEIEYFNRLGTLDDFISWFGLDYAPRYASDYLSGRKTLEEALSAQAEKTYQAPISRAIGGGIPFTKLALETLGRRQLYPDVFRPGTIRDRYEYIARSFGLENEYKFMAGLPSRGYGKSLKNIFMYHIDPGEAAYRDIYDLKVDFFKKKGKTTEGFWLTPTGDALYNMKLAVKYEDKEAFSKYYNEFIDSAKEQMRTGAIAEIVPSIIQGLHPLNGLSIVEQGMFIKSLTKEDKEVYDRAMDFYKETLSALPKQDWTIEK